MCRLISRQDLMDWRAQFEYEVFPEALDQVRRFSAYKIVSNTQNVKLHMPVSS